MRSTQFATGPDAVWAGNFRDLNAAVTRMATLAAGGRISVDLVQDEIIRLRLLWSGRAGDDRLADLIDAETLAAIDLFDRLQLASVVGVCRRCSSLSEAGRQLFAASRQNKSTANDADRLRKFLARFDLNWQQIKSQY